MSDTDRSVLMPLEPVTVSADLSLDLPADRLFIVARLDGLAIGAKHARADRGNDVFPMIPVDVLDALVQQFLEELWCSSLESLCQANAGYYRSCSTYKQTA